MPKRPTWAGRLEATDRGPFKDVKKKWALFFPFCFLFSGRWPVQWGHFLFLFLWAFGVWT
jgi:hypothetical protein